APPVEAPPRAQTAPQHSGSPDDNGGTRGRAIEDRMRNVRETKLGRRLVSTWQPPWRNASRPDGRRPRNLLPYRAPPTPQALASSTDGHASYPARAQPYCDPGPPYHPARTTPEAAHVAQPDIQLARALNQRRPAGPCRHP